jgi:hypothetical protein
VISPVSIEVALPKARNAKVVLAKIAMEGGSAILTLFTLLLRLDDLPV